MSFLWNVPFTSCGLCIDGFLEKGGVAQRCDCRRRYEEDTRLLFHLYEANLITQSSSLEQALRVRDYNLDLYRGPDEQENIPKIKKFLDQFDTRYSHIHLYFQGTYGTQKTTLARYMGKELVLRGKSVYYTFLNDLMRIICNDRDEEKLALSDKILNCDFLILDEVEEKKLVLYKESQWQMRHYLSWIKQRLEGIRKSTLFISNTDITNIGPSYDGAVKDLLQRETTETTLIFEDIYAKVRDKINLKSIWED